MGSRRNKPDLESAMDSKQVVEILSEKIESLKADFSAKLDSMMKEFVSKLEAKDKEIAELRGSVSALSRKVSDLEVKIEDGEAYERRDSLLFSGNEVPAVATDESPTDLVVGLIKKHLKLVVPVSAISIAHRVGMRPATQSPDRRAIIVKFCRRDIRNEIIYLCRQLKPRDFFANESLTPQRSKILRSLRQLKSDFPAVIQGTGTINGRVFAWVKQDNNDRNHRVFVNSSNCFDEFKLKYLST